MKRPSKVPMEAEDIFALLEEFYKRGFTKKDMKDIIDIWWKVGDALKLKQRHE
jgi:hypothetical protein